jgi:hypothetical protein
MEHWPYALRGRRGSGPPENLVNPRFSDELARDCRGAIAVDFDPTPGRFLDDCLLAPQRHNTPPAMNLDEWNPPAALDPVVRFGKFGRNQKSRILRTTATVYQLTQPILPA